MKKKSPWFLILVLLMQFLLNVHTKAQEQVTKGDSLYSQISQEQRFLHIVLPENYNPASLNKYEIVLLPG